MVQVKGTKAADDRLQLMTHFGLVDWMINHGNFILIFLNILLSASFLFRIILQDSSFKALIYVKSFVCIVNKF